MDFKAFMTAAGFLVSGNATKGFFVVAPARGDFKRVYALCASFGGLVVSKNTKVFPQLVVVNEL